MQNADATRLIDENIFEVEGAQTSTIIAVMDEPGAGGANHDYSIRWLDPANEILAGECRIRFQNGPVKEFGVNGVTHEQLLAIVADRLQCFQDGPYPSKFNAEALESVQNAIHVLHIRTAKQMRHNVEGRTIT